MERRVRYIFMIFHRMTLNGEKSKIHISYKIQISYLPGLLLLLPR